MNIKDTFSKDIFRPISGVVKADQLDGAVVWQELEEYVITGELEEHFRAFFSAYTACMKRGYDPREAERMAVWIAGFFGSGKSHFLKVLSYILRNITSCDPESGACRNALQFFEGKKLDALTMADIKLAAGVPVDVMLFNIGSKSDSSDGSGAVLSVFWNVFNEMQGFSPDVPHLADMERFLTEKGCYQDFCRIFQELTGDEWVAERDGYLFYKDQVVEALAGARGLSREAASDWFDKAEQTFSFTVEAFAKQVRDYLDTKGTNHRVIFLVDEVGQFIGNDGHLMLSLQQITEDLGVHCQGRAWIAVTSQADIEAVLGDLKTARANDFSKITGRFATRLSLSGQNTDKVILARLLEKNTEGDRKLQGVYEQKQDILKSQIRFTSDGATIKDFRGAADFSAHNPFAPYHFEIVKKIFESIRKTGLAGMSLSGQERSMLDAFQSAAKAVSPREIGTLAPLHAFYPCIENLLDVAVKSTIASARDNPGLEMPFDGHLLQTLFLIRHVDLIKPNAENLTTLFIDQVDTDRLALQRAVQSGLQRLEKETLISRSGDLYFFLTNEERAVGREIKALSISTAEESRLVADLLFAEVLKDQNKYKHKPFKRDYGFNRLLDGHPYGSKVDQEIGLEFITPFHDEYVRFANTRCLMYATENYGRGILKLGAPSDLVREVRTWVRTDKYIRTKSDASLSPSLKKILSDHQEENRLRKGRIADTLAQLILEAEIYALGQTLDGLQGGKSGQPRGLVEEVLGHLVGNIYNKFDYLAGLHDDPIKEIKALLQSGDIGKKQAQLVATQSNPQATKEMRELIRLKAAANHTLTLADLVDQFGRRPYGWPEWEIVLITARLFMAGEILFTEKSQPLEPKAAIDPLTKTARWKEVKILKVIEASEEEQKKARNLFQSLFGKIPPEPQKELDGAIRAALGGWRSALAANKPLADTEEYPGKQEMKEGLEVLGKLLTARDAAQLISLFNAHRDELRDLGDDVHTLTDFYTNQRPVWERLRKAVAGFRKNEAALDRHEQAGPALRRLTDILKAPAPYPMLREVDGLISTIASINDDLLAAKREQALLAVEHKLTSLAKSLDAAKAEADLRNTVLYPLQETKRHIAQETSIPGISYHLEDSAQLLDDALHRIDTAKPVPLPDQPSQPNHTPKPPKQVKTVKPADLTPSAYLESPQDVEDFVTSLRTRLLAELNENVRIRIG